LQAYDSTILANHWKQTQQKKEKKTKTHHSKCNLCVDNTIYKTFAKILHKKINSTASSPKATVQLQQQKTKLSPSSSLLSCSITIFPPPLLQFFLPQIELLHGSLNSLVQQISRDTHH
jgi:hypothetical protein